MTARHSRPNSHNTAGGTERPAGASRPTVQALRLLDVYQESWSATRMYWKAPQYPMAARHSRPNSHNTAGGTERPAGAARPTVQALRLLDVYQELVRHKDVLGGAAVSERQRALHICRRRRRGRRRQGGLGTARHSRPNSHNTAGGTARPAGASRPTVQALRLLDVHQELVRHKDVLEGAAKSAAEEPYT